MSRVLFVNHTSVLSGAELVLLDLVAAAQKPSAFLFSSGALNLALSERGVAVQTARYGSALGSIKRDSNLLKAVPQAGAMAGILGELTLAARRHDVIYANSQKAFVLGSLASAVSRRPLIWHLHDIISKDHFGDRQRRLQVSLANRFASAVICPSKDVADAFVAEGGKAELTRVVPNGIDVTPDFRSKAELRKALGLPDGPLLGVFSRLAPWKGQHVVLRALTKLPGVHAAIAGTALFGEDTYARSLTGLAADLGLSDRVTFLGHRSDVPKLMQAVDVVVHPSVQPEPFGRTLVEAMSVRTPVVASDAGAAAEILDHGAAGRLFTPGNDASLIAALQQALTPGPERDALLDQAQARAKDRYGVARMQAGIAAVIDSVTRRRR